MPWLSGYRPDHKIIQIQNVIAYTDDFNKKLIDDLTTTLLRELMKIDFTSLLQPP